MAFQGDSIYWVEVEKIVPNPFQPRREFDEQKLKELADSVRMYGILQPLTVTRREIQREDETFYTEYELIAGERRLRASKLAGLAQVPVIIREGEESEQEKLELAIIENLQREDLNAVDRALAFRQLADVFGLSHIQVARKVGRSREYVSNSIRLLGLPDYMLNALRQGEISEGHARTLLMLNDKPEEQDVVFREILLKKISVRETESIVRKLAMEKVRKKTLPDFDTQLIEIEKRFMETLGTRVQIQKTEYGGRLTIDYFNVDDLEEMLKRMRAGEPLSNISYTGATLTEAVPLVDLKLMESNDVTLAQSVIGASDVSGDNDLSYPLNQPDESRLSISTDSAPTNTVSAVLEVDHLATVATPPREPEVIVGEFKPNEAAFSTAETALSWQPSQVPQVYVPPATQVSVPPVRPAGVIAWASPEVIVDESDLAKQEQALIKPSNETEWGREDGGVAVSPAPLDNFDSNSVVTTPTPAPALPVVNQSSPTVPVTPISEPSKPVSIDKDDSDLYSIRHFTI